MESATNCLRPFLPDNCLMFFLASACHPLRTLPDQHLLPYNPPMATFLLWLVILLPIIGPAVAVSVPPTRLALCALGFTVLYSLLFSTWAFAVLERSSVSGDGGGKGLIYLIAALVGAFINGIVFSSKAFTTVFHTDGYGK